MQMQYRTRFRTIGMRVGMSPEERAACISAQSADSRAFACKRSRWPESRNCWTSSERRRTLLTRKATRDRVAARQFLQRDLPEG